jgi:hypothetical protein
MKKIIPILFATVFIATFCLAQEPAEPINETASRPADIKSFAGSVALVYSEDTLDDFPGRIEVVDEKGQRLVFLIIEKIAVSDKDGKQINLRKVNNNDKVIVDYIIGSNNRKIAQSIKLSE